MDVHAVRGHFAFPKLGRIVTNNAASTQPPDELLELYQSLAPGYENVHRGQSSASQAMTALFEESYDTIARFIGAPGRASIALYRNTTEAHNAVMYSLLSEFRNGDNVVTTTMEHNSTTSPGMRCAARSCHAWDGECTTGWHDSIRSPVNLTWTTCVVDRHAYQARLLHWRLELPRHQEPAANHPRARKRQRLPTAQRGAAFPPAYRWRATRARVFRRRSRP